MSDSNDMPAFPPPDARLLEEAADWAIAFQYDAPDTTTRAAFKEWYGRSAAHAAAWERAQGVFRSFEQIPAKIGKDVLGRARHLPDRRRALRLLVGAGLVAPVGAIAWRDKPWREWLADVRTVAGERRALTLPDASELVLNTSSAVDIAFGPAERRLRLVTGEILVTTRPDTLSVPRPFLIETPQGMVRALGTRFAIRQFDGGQIRVSVFEHAVEIAPARGARRTIEAGQQAVFTASSVGGPHPVEENAEIWQHGMLLAQDMRLADVVTELARYRHGVLRCDPDVANLRVSGAVSLSDTDNALDLLATGLPVRIVRRTSWWVTVAPRD